MAETLVGEVRLKPQKQEQMMKIKYYRPIALDGIIAESFPDIALYLRNSGHYTLYKPHDRKFTERDRERLMESQIDFLYVRVGDMEPYTAYLESNLTEVLTSEKISSEAKGKVLYQTTANYVTDLFESPESSENLSKCRILVRQLIKYISTDEDIMKAFGAIVANNYYIFTHSVKVAALSMLMHEKLFEITRGEMVDVGVGSLLHDFGMIFISSAILDKPDALSEVEYHKVKQHAQRGYEYLKDNAPIGEVALTIIRHHHEKFDGSGYPCGLKGNDIPRSAQLTALCNVYSALTTDRPYGKTYSPSQALKIMRDDSPGSFNRELLHRFEEIITTRVEE